MKRRSGMDFTRSGIFPILKTTWVIDKGRREYARRFWAESKCLQAATILMFDPFVAAEMLELLADALRGDQVLKGKSFWRRRWAKECGRLPV